MTETKIVEPTKPVRKTKSNTCHCGTPLHNVPDDSTVFTFCLKCSPVVHVITNFWQSQNLQCIWRKDEK